MALGRLFRVDTDATSLQRTEQMLLALSLLMLGGAAILILYSLSQEGVAASLKSIGISLILAGSGLVIGGLIGFLFGIPLSVQPSPTAGAGAATTTTRTSFRPNTSLEQISDWLTKMLVGVGLTQLNKAPDLLRSLGEYLAKGMGTAGEGGGVFLVATLLLYSVCGFLYGFLWTRLFLAGAFLEADVGSLIARSQKDRDEADAEALRLVNEQLGLAPGEADVPQEKLNEVIAGASSSTRVSILNQAQTVRKENRLTDKVRMARTIPVFRALIAGDPNRHRPHGNLGWALKDRKEPDLKGALEELTTAITLRNKEGDRYWSLYDMSRALCRINLDPEFKAGKPSTAENKKAILDDLHEAASRVLPENFTPDPSLVKWAELNKVDLKAELTPGLPAGGSPPAT